MSQSASLQSASAKDEDSPAKHAEAQPTIEPVNEYEDAERNFQAKSPRFWAIIVGLYLAIFLVALVSP